MPGSITFIPSPNLKRVMVFIDGGYFKEAIDSKFGKDKSKDPEVMSKALNHLINDMIVNINFPHSKPEIIRVYYYDARYSYEDKEFKNQNQIFKKIKDSVTYPFEIKLGRLVRSGKNRKELRQKGVDVLLSIDMVSKAFLNHYDIAILVSGDQDFLDAVKIIKDMTDKKVAGYYVPSNRGPPRTSEDLIRSFDHRFPRIPSPLFDNLNL